MTEQQAFNREVILDQFAAANKALLAHCIELEKQKEGAGTDEFFELILCIPGTKSFIGMKKTIQAARK